MGAMDAREPGERPRAEVEAAEKADEPLVCSYCGHRITSEDERMEVDGAHESVRVNLAGMLFRIGCFRRAPGVRGVGEASASWSWFAGYTWQVAVCARCGEHLGWIYRGADRFHGLLLDSLRPGAATGSSR